MSKSNFLGPPCPSALPPPLPFPPQDLECEWGQMLTGRRARRDETRREDNVLTRITKTDALLPRVISLY
ncbi:hypothetical protein E2C01_062269 [Portunus trituberculatus]|uniref:Uncharacterized protein n=1 Tax=Portunus trituberculatus TaxID=210409 RepID=A0A5B7HFM7_PORTR|nr:hypothetical protein [Portunus trituberculatus]